MGRIKEISRKPSGSRKRNPVIYLICEGEETEIRYFKGFRSRSCYIDIKPIASQYKSADSLVRKARTAIGKSPYYPEDGDVIWCVFDCDDNTDAMLHSAVVQARREGYHIAFSNPAFEIWFLYHFTTPTVAMDNTTVIRQLRQPGRLENYEKHQDVYNLLKALQMQAIQRAEQRLRELGEQKLIRNSNPCTTVVELVKYLNAKRGTT